VSQVTNPRILELEGLLHLGVFVHGIINRVISTYRRAFMIIYYLDKEKDQCGHTYNTFLRPLAHAGSSIILGPKFFLHSVELLTLLNG
jgi:hypothetical protein